MGLLDDAIRQHLDLKRRRGADPTEIERAEQEALGPVRRTPEDPEADEQPQDPSAPQGSLDYQENGEQGWGESFDEESELFGEQPAPLAGHVPAEPAQRQPESAPESNEPDFSDEFATRQHIIEPDPLIDEPKPAAPEAAAPPPPPPSAASPPPPERPSDPESQAGESAPPSPQSPRRPSQETAEYDVEQELEKDPDDVLEETPEFLQDTPEHDRLWFEQRPPRDFDFDG